MLGIKTKSGGWRSWWLGCEIPTEAEDRVVTFQADGDELNLILQAMEATLRPLPGSHIGYTKIGGFLVHDTPPRAQQIKTKPMAVPPTPKKKIPTELL